MNSLAPTPIRLAGCVVAAQGALGLLIALVLIIRDLMGESHSKISVFGTVAWFGLIGLGVAVAGVCLARGATWGRGVAIVSQILLLPFAWALLTDSGQPAFGVLVGVVALSVLAILLSPKAFAWSNADDS